MKETSSGRRSTGMALAAASAIALLAAAQPVAAQETIKIGGIAPITGGGAIGGAMSQAAWKLAIDEINADGGILGKKVELVMADTTTDPTHAVSETRRLVDNEKIAALVGPVTSQEAIAVLAVTNDAKLVQVSTAASGQLTPTFAPFHFSTSPLGANQMIPNVDYAIDVLKVSKIAIISDNGGMSKAGVQDVLAYMKGRGIEPVVVQEFAFRAEDMTPQLFSMRNAGAEAVLLINSLPDDSRRFLQNREDIGWEVPVLGNITTSSYGKTLADALGEGALENVYGTQFIGVTYCPGDAVGSSAFSKYSEKARAAISNIDQIGGPAAIAQYYLELKVLAAAMNGAGKTDGEALVQWLTTAPAIDTVLGPFKATPESHFLPSLETMVVVKTPHMLREDGLYERAHCAK